MVTQWLNNGLMILRFKIQTLQFKGKDGAHQSEALVGIQSNSTLLAMSTNIRLGRKWMVVENTLAYYGMTTVQTPLFYRPFL